MKKLALNWAAFVAAFIAAGALAGVFLGGPAAGRVGSGVVAALAALAAWRLWNTAAGRTTPREAVQAPSGRPWDR